MFTGNHYIPYMAGKISIEFRNKEFRSEMKNLFKICSSKDTKSMSTVTQTTRISSQISPEDTS